MHRILPFLAALAAFAQSPRDCAGMAAFQIPGTALTISAARQIAAGPAPAGRPGAPAGPVLPAYCRIDGTLEPRTGVDGKPYGIGFALALPDAWNGRFLFQGGGGLNGSVGMPLGAQAAGDSPALARGYAVLSMDSGHKGSGAFDASFMTDQQAALDFYYAAIGKMTPVARVLIAAYYGKPAAHSYYAGCSTGGREAMVVTQRYPLLFDGVVVGNPAMRTGYSNLALAYIGAVFAEAGKSADLFSPAEKKLIVDSLLTACDAKDGLKDGMIFNSRGCGFDPASLSCKAGQSDACIAPAKVAALQKAFAGPKDIRGAQIYPGFLYDAGIGESGPGLPGLLAGPRIPVPTSAGAGPFDADKAAARIAADVNAGIGDSTWTRLSSFSAHGGKVIYYHGNSDPWFSPLDTLGYYERMTGDNGGREKVESWARLYLVPGMGHCSGGSATLDRFDMLTAIADWVEKGVPPASVVASGRAFPGRTRPLCAWPRYAHYKGQGNPDDAASFECREP